MNLFTKDNIIIALLVISLCFNVHLLRENVQIKKGLKAQLEMINSIAKTSSVADGTPEASGAGDQSRHDVYMKLFKGIIEEINKINAKLGKLDTVKSEQQAEKPKSKQEDSGQGFSFSDFEKNPEKLEELIRQSFENFARQNP